MLVSIIVPVYNVAEYLIKCIDSLLSQTYKEIEIIFIDDGSTDSSGKILDEYKEKDRRIVVVHTANSGVSSARNLGLSIANGELISFVDADDYVSDDYVNSLFAAMNEKDVNVAECGSYLLYDDGKLISKCDKGNKTRILDYVEYLAEKNLKGMCTYSVVWGKLYHRKLFDGVSFPTTLKNAEDEATVYKLIYKSKEVARVPRPLYYYRQRKEGASKTSFNMSFYENVVYAYSSGIAFFDEKGEKKLKDVFSCRLSLFQIRSFNSLPPVIREEVRADIRRRFKEIKKKNVPLKIWAYIFAFIHLRIAI